MTHLTLSKYALCEVEDVADLLGYNDTETDMHRRMITRAINSATDAITDRSQREFFIPDDDKNETRWFQFDAADVRRMKLRVGDMAQVTPDEVKVYGPDSDPATAVTLSVANDIWLEPRNPKKGRPWEFVKIKSTAPVIPGTGYWMSVKTDWGFPEVPDTIVQIAIATAASWILNDVMKLAELARQSGRKVRFESLIPEEFLETVDNFRIYRVA